MSLFCYYLMMALLGFIELVVMMNDSNHSPLCFIIVRFDRKKSDASVPCPLSLYLRDCTIPVPSERRLPGVASVFACLSVSHHNVFMLNHVIKYGDTQ